MQQIKSESEETLMTYRRRKRSRGGGPSISFASGDSEMSFNSRLNELKLKMIQTIKDKREAQLETSASEATMAISRDNSLKDTSTTNLPQSCEGETVKHTPSVSQVADAPVTHQKVEIISCAENITTVEETGFCKAQNKQKCLNQQRRRPHRKRKSEKVSIELSDSENSAEQPLSASNSHGSSKGENCNYAIAELERKLDDKTFQCYLQNMWVNFSEEKKISFTHLDSLWYSIYSTERGREKVLKWIKKKDIFSKKYVFVPIVQWFVFDIYRTHGRAVNRKLLNKMPFLVPKVPQQINGEECGFYVLYYINLFFEGAPENFSYSNGYPYFMKQDWFTPEGFNCFCKTLDSSGDDDDPF